MTTKEKDTGIINAEKYVSTEILTSTDNQIVTYSINFQSYGYFDKNFVDVIDNMNNNVKILSVEVLSNFTYSINKEANTIIFENSNGEISYGDNFSIKIVTDFTNVPDGTTVNNKAKINKTITNTVQTKKGYAFKAVKVDSENANIVLEGAVFDLKDKSNNTITKLTSNSEGIITAPINSPGIYYLQEVNAPNGYFIDDEPIKFTITPNEVGQTINLGNIENNKGYEINIKKVDKNNPSKLLVGAEFQIYDINNTPNKLITTVTTNSDGIGKVILPEGEYKLIETKKAIGYDISKSIEFQVNEEKEGLI
ncbi:MSCRAMM family protein [Clostridium chauvoei]|uniref:MSCRAMM family protein n=1 Tax=Clostridium chauvoei TaxID=46867 RepID=UPI00207A9F4D|nr:SpaA isopeptide-forming pilin-related protein [Clostridium chauvoei]